MELGAQVLECVVTVRPTPPGAGQNVVAPPDQAVASLGLTSLA